MFNSDAIFTLYNCDIKELEFVTFLEFIVKEGIKLLSQYFKEDPIMYVHKYVICLYVKKRLICLTSPSADIILRVTPYNLYCDEDSFN